MRWLLIHPRGFEGDSEPFVLAEIPLQWWAEEVASNGSVITLSFDEASEEYPKAVAAWLRGDDSAAEADHEWMLAEVDADALQCDASVERMLAEESTT